MVGGPSSWHEPAPQMGLSELFEGGSLMYINWQTAHPVGGRPGRSPAVESGRRGLQREVGQQGGTVWVEARAALWAGQDALRGKE